MTRREEVRDPDIGDFHDVEIVEVLVRAGDTVSAEAPLITLETDKASMEVPTPLAGRIAELKVARGDRVSKGSLIDVRTHPRRRWGEYPGRGLFKSTSGNL